MIKMVPILVSWTFRTARLELLFVSSPKQKLLLGIEEVRLDVKKIGNKHNPLRRQHQVANPHLLRHEAFNFKAGTAEITS